MSPAFEITIPRAVREALGIRPGQRIDVLAYDGRMELVPVRHPRELRGFAEGIDTVIERDGDRV
ncbi:AbrB/MazE/SpoVT family DNA-binding domain-containing protein [Longimicrobium sp.]|uniref:AbrB/MazE/SpoVT family DNA-binding domain-containing protein n=1 Tax=Longimicrobium sp. TaxID=2029185 RepID=UPI002CA27F21|nr:AbrB/MazE/SpoVT family DNA-binding domain-containing protein [Longimicrobium sp.]HSU15468.1 AbrB/MazE/SpoVT family DNA-binding domain-containing protein [Longimicrobium sp.]